MRSSRVTPNTVGTPNQWNALHEDARGASRLLAHQMYGTIALPTNPTNGKTLTLAINGNDITITFVSSIGTAAGNVLIGASAAATAANLLQLLQNPTVSSSTQVAIGTNTSVNVTLVNYIAWSLISGGTSIIASSNAFSLYTPDTSFSASTNVTGGSYTANTMALYVEPGVVYVNGTEVYFAGGITSTVTAPVSHPRIDVLSIDSTGTLNWTTGTEASSPSTPAYPANQIPICELYNVVGETALYDQSNSQSGQGYLYNDVRPFLSTGVALGAVPDNIIPSANNTYNLGSSGEQWANGYFGTGVFVNGLGVAITKFGGTGADGSLSISSGTTTLALGSARYSVKNYTSISITGTAALTFSSPHAMGTYIKIRSQGALTVTSSATAAVIGDGLGASAGKGVAGAQLYNAGTITTGTSAGGGGGGGSQQGYGSTGGGVAGGLGGNPLMGLAPWATLIEPGGGGSSGQTGYANGFSGGTPGTGGTGGASIDFEIAGNINITATFSSKGATGGASPNNSSGGYSGGGGGGGGGGSIRILYNGSVTANSATFTVTGGSGGSVGSGGTVGTSGAAGANGDSLVAANTFFA